MQIEVSNAEIVDKATIVKLKAERIEDSTKKVNIQKEYVYLMQKVKELGMDADSDLFKKLYDINARIWDTEANLRLREEAKNFDAQFIQWSRDEYTLNDERAVIKKRSTSLPSQISWKRKVMPLLHRVINQFVNRSKPAWYRDVPPTFSWTDGHDDFRRGDYKTGFRKHSRSLEYIDKKILTLPYLREHGITLAMCGGLGDSIQFLRFAKMLHEQGVRVTLRMSKKYKPLVELFSYQSYVDGIVEEEYTGSHAVNSVNLKSTPYLLDIDLHTIPTGEYISVDTKRVEAYREQMRTDANFKIGVQFMTSPDKRPELNNNRGIDPSFFSLITAPVSFYSLERDNLPDKKGMRLIELGERRSVMDSAAIIKNMDLVITGATMMSNLAAALQVPTWTLLPHPCPSYRYYYDEVRMPWYPTMRLFRQSTKKEWPEVFAKVNVELGKEVQKGVP